MSSTDFNKAEFTKNIGKDGMQCYDNDLKFMGAHEICKMVTQDKLTSEMPEMEQYIDALFLQLKPDMTSEVKGNAVSCMSRICTKLNSTQIEKIVKELISQITSTDKELEDVRDIFVMCIKNIIQEVPHDFHDKLIIVITEADKGIRSARKNKQSKNEQELVEIITLMFKRWGTIYEGVQFKELIHLLKQNVINSNVDENLRKKSCTSIGAVSVVLNREEVSSLVNELIQEHQKIKKPKDQQHQLKAISFTINALSKSVPQKMEGQVKELVGLLKSEFNNWGLQEDPEDFDFVSVICELYESYLSIMENLIKGCSVSCFDIPTKQELIQLSVELLTMDPNLYCCIEDEEEEEMDEEDEDSDNDYMDSDVDQDDQSWRVRRSAMLLVEKIILTDKHMLDSIYHNMIAKTVEPKKNIIKRLREKNEGVRSTIIQVLTSFIKQIMVSDTFSQQQSNMDEHEDFGFSEEPTLKRVISKLTHFDLQDVIDPIKEEVQKIYHDKKSNNQLKIQAFRLVENLSSSVGKQILEREQLWTTIFSLLSGILKEKNVESEIKVSCLLSLKKVLKYREQTDLRHIQFDLLQIFDIVKELVKSDQFKIIAESLRLISGMFRIIKKCFSSQISQYSQQINDLLPTIIKILSQADVDQEIKHAVISVASGILIHIGQTINVDQVATIFQHLLQKVDNENKNRIIILKLYKRIPIEISQQLNQQCRDFLNQTTGSLTKFLAKEDRSERIATLEALNKLVQILGQNIDHQISNKIIDSSIHMIKPKESKDMDPHLASIALSIYKNIISIRPQPCEQYNKILDGCLYLSGSTIFQANRYDVLYEVLSFMAQSKLIEIQPTINQLIAKPSHDAIHSTAKAIASLVLVDNNKDKIIESIAKNYALKSSGNDEDKLHQRQTALLTLCEFGKKHNLTNNSFIFNGILDLIQNKNEDLDKIRKYASIAFGGISLQDLDKALPKVIELINQHKNSYLMLNTLKEIIQNSQHIQPQQLTHIVDFLLKQAGVKQESSEQDLRNIVSECLGKLGIYNLAFLKPKLLDGLKSPNENVRYSIASSYKFFFNQQGKLNSTPQDQHDLVKALVHMVNDQNINTREAVVKSLNSIAYNLPQIIEEDIRPAFFEQLKPSFDYYEVIETDLGAFKDKRDKGAPLRTSSFQLLQTCFNFKHVYDFHEQILQACINTIAKESEADIKMLRVSVILRLAETNPQIVTKVCNKIKDAMVSIMRIFANAKPIPDSSYDLVRQCCKVLHTIDINMVNKDPDYNTFLEKLKAQCNEKFGKIFQTFSFQQ